MRNDEVSWELVMEMGFAENAQKTENFPLQNESLQK